MGPHGETGRSIVSCYHLEFFVCTLCIMNRSYSIFCCHSILWFGVIAQCLTFSVVFLVCQWTELNSWYCYSHYSGLPITFVTYVWLRKLWQMLIVLFQQLTLMLYLPITLILISSWISYAVLCLLNQINFTFRYFILFHYLRCFRVWMTHRIRKTSAGSQINLSLIESLQNLTIYSSFAFGITVYLSKQSDLRSSIAINSISIIFHHSHQNHLWIGDCQGAD
jgi:hypothetical protein